MTQFNSFENSLRKLERWIEQVNYKSWDPFDGLKSPIVKLICFNNRISRTIWQQFFKISPINLRPLVGIKKGIVSKAIGDFVSAYLILALLYNDDNYRKDARKFLDCLKDHVYSGYSGYCWGVGFNYQSRVIYAEKDVPNIITTCYNANAFVDAFEQLSDQEYLDIASSACDFIIRDIGFTEDGDCLCLNYYPTQDDQIHNANMLGAALLARVYQYTKNKRLINLANKAVKYTLQYQREDGSWFYGEKPSLRWIDNFHTGYILEALHTFFTCTGNSSVMSTFLSGVNYYRSRFFLSDGTPKYYFDRVYPIDIQCAAQAIQTFARIGYIDKSYLDTAKRVAKWTINNMQDKNGYFYYQKIPFFLNRMPYLRWGESTMFLALTHLIKAMKNEGEII